MNAVPLRLTWRVGEMAAPAHPLHLDGLVAFAMLRQAEALGVATEERGKSVREFVNGLDLPFAREERDGAWCWAASALIASEVLGNGMRMWTRKINLDEIAERVADGVVDLGNRVLDDSGAMKPYAGRVDTARGPYKQWMKYIPTRTPGELVAWCVGDPERLAELLDPESEYVTHLGARTRQGLGRIIGFDIQEDQDAKCLWQRRVLPWPYEGAVQTMMAVRPPYWAAENRAPAWIDPAIL